MDESHDITEALAAAPVEQVPVPPAPFEEAPYPGVRLWSPVGVKLAATMFLHHFALGSWIVTLGSFVDENAGEGRMFTKGFVGVVYGAGPIGGMIAPLVTGFLADHFFATERIMLVLHLAAAAALYAAVTVHNQWAFLAAMIGYFLCFSPSFALTCSMTLHHLERPNRDFPVARAWSTGGWIAGGLFVGWFWPTFISGGQSIEKTTAPLMIGVAGELALAVYSLFLPHTPPTKRRVGQAAERISGSQTIDLFRDPKLLILIVLAVLAHVPAQFYNAYANVFFNWTGMHQPAAKMVLGQCMEVACMVLLPSVLMRVSTKTAILIGMSVWGLRYLAMSAALGASSPARDLLLYGAIVVHGIAFTFVTISMQLEVDCCAGRESRATAQGLITVAMTGLGYFLGSELAGLAEAAWLTGPNSANVVAGWEKFWAAPGIMSALVFGLIWAFLPQNRRETAGK
jgi:nucleoside transporter